MIKHIISRPWNHAASCFNSITRFNLNLAEYNTGIGYSSSLYSFNKPHCFDLNGILKDFISWYTSHNGHCIISINSHYYYLISSVNYWDFQLKRKGLLRRWHYRHSQNWGDRSVGRVTINRHLLHSRFVLSIGNCAMRCFRSEHSIVVSGSEQTMLQRGVTFTTILTYVALHNARI